MRGFYNILKSYGINSQKQSSLHFTFLLAMILKFFTKQKIYVDGIAGITSEDITFAKSFGFTVILLPTTGPVKPVLYFFIKYPLLVGKHTAIEGYHR